MYCMFNFGITDSVTTCLSLSYIPLYKNMLNDLLRSVFLQEYISQINEILV